MDSSTALAVYRKYLKEGGLQETYHQLLSYLLELKAAFPSSYQTGNLSPGYLDVTYFPFKNEALSKKKLRFGLILRHENLGLELWLMGQTLALQKSYWENWKESKWAKGRTDMAQYAIFEILLL